MERDKQPRKTVMNSVIYPSKNAPTSTTSLSARPKLISFGGIISRHRTSNFRPTSRPKLIATTSLLTMFCLFSLNILTLPISSGNGRPGSSVQASELCKIFFILFVVLFIMGCEPERLILFRLLFALWCNYEKS